MRPWLEPGSPVRDRQVRYLWKTSIPTSWVKLKGPKHFQKDTHEKRGAELRSNHTQRYIDSITQHTTVRPSKLLVPRPKPISPKLSPVPTAHSSILLPMFSQTFSSSRTALPSQWTQSKPQLYPVPRSVQVLSLQLETGELTDTYIVNSYLRPKRLVGVKRKEQGHGRQWSDVEVYLRRFDHNEDPKEPLGSRKGMSGWKLSAARGRRSRETSRASELLSTNKSLQPL